MGTRLVRDNALINWVVPGAESQVRHVRSRQEHLLLLKKKLLEESAEVVTATSDLEVKKELSDVLDVVVCLYGVSTLDNPKEFLQGALDRLRSAESFGEGMVWETPR